MDDRRYHALYAALFAVFLSMAVWLATVSAPWKPGAEPTTPYSGVESSR